jgi:hypothetical protein
MIALTMSTILLFLIPACVVLGGYQLKGFTCRLFSHIMNVRRICPMRPYIATLTLITTFGEFAITYTTLQTWTAQDRLSLHYLATSLARLRLVFGTLAFWIVLVEMLYWHRKVDAPIFCYLITAPVILLY